MCIIHVTYAWVISHIDESFHIWMSYCSHLHMCRHILYVDSNMYALATARVLMYNTYLYVHTHMNYTCIYVYRHLHICRHIFHVDTLYVDSYEHIICRLIWTHQQQRVFFVRITGYNRIGPSLTVGHSCVCIHVCVYVCVYTCVCMCVCVCVRERESRGTMR